MIQPSRGLDLAQKTVRAERGSELGMQNLERNESLVLYILSEVDGRHPAPSQLTIYCVAVLKGSAQAFDRTGRHHIAWSSAW